MPFYEYVCSECNTVITIMHGVGEEKEDLKCPNCDATGLKRVFSQFNSIFPEGFGGSSCDGNCGGGSGGFG